MILFLFNDWGWGGRDRTVRPKPRRGDLFIAMDRLIIFFGFSGAAQDDWHYPGNRPRR